MIYLGADHAGFELKERIKQWLGEWGYEFEDKGAFALDPQDDYPDFVAKVAKAVSENQNNRGIFAGGSGQGEAMAANRYKNVRCAVFYAPSIPALAADIAGRKSEDPFEIIRLAREHNNSNLLSLGARFLREEEAQEAVRRWLETPFSGEERHARRLKQIEAREVGE